MIRKNKDPSNDIAGFYETVNVNETGTSSDSLLLIKHGASEFSSSQKGSLRWIALFFICFSNFGPYFCFDNPQPLQNTIETQFQITTYQYNLLYTLYSLPNIVLALVGGLFIDKIGIRISMMFFSFLTIIGQVFVTLGAAHLSFPGLLVGRLLFGIGEESLIVGLHTMIAKWFKGKELAFAFGINLTVSRLSSSCNSFFTPRIYEWSGQVLAMPFIIGTILNCGSFICCLSLCYVDRKNDASKENSEEISKKDHKISLKDFKSFTLLYYLLLINCGLLYGAYFGLSNNLNDMMLKRFGFNSKSAGSLILIIYISSAIINPLFGFFIDKIGKRGKFILVSAGICFFTHFLLLVLHDGTELSPNYGVIGALLAKGLFISILSPVFWPCISLVVDKKATGTAYGIVGSMVNLAIASVPLVFGAIHDATKDSHAGYFWPEVLLLILASVSIFVTTLICIVDKKTGGELEKIHKKE